jgi:hypothetical protein
MQPTKSHKYLVTGGVAADAFVALRNKFDTSTHWEVQFQTSDTGFVVRQLLGDTTSQYLFVRSTNNVTMRIDPSGTITDGSGTGISAMASGATDAIPFNTAYWQFHEWRDAFTIFTANYASSIVGYPQGIHAGYIHNPAFSTDPSVGLTGQGFLAGPPDTAGGGNAWFPGASTSTDSRIRVAATGVQATDWVQLGMNISTYASVAGGHVNGNLIGGRDQPEPIVACVTTATSRKVGMMKYIFTRQPTAVPGTCQFVGGVRKMQHFASSHTTSTQAVMGVEDDFQPAGAPT